MGLLYTATKWLDHVTQYPMRKRITQNADGTSDITRDEGGIIQQGTPRNAKNYNNMESGILANQIYCAILEQQVLQLKRSSEENRGEFGTVTIQNTSMYPFSSATVSILIKEQRSNLEYTVDVEVLESDGNVERINVIDKQLNGFKIAFQGSAKSAKLRYKILGGRY